MRRQIGPRGPDRITVRLSRRRDLAPRRRHKRRDHVVVNLTQRRLQGSCEGVAMLMRSCRHIFTNVVARDTPAEALTCSSQTSLEHAVMTCHRSVHGQTLPIPLPNPYSTTSTQRLSAVMGKPLQRDSRLRIMTKVNLHVVIFAPFGVLLLTSQNLGFAQPLLNSEKWRCYTIATFE